MTGAQAYSQAHFGAGSGPIYLDDVRCTGSEASLTSCTSKPIGMDNCQHSEDAGIACGGTFALNGLHGHILIKSIF